MWAGELSETALKVTVPVKPLTGVIVKVTPDAVAPDLAVALAVHKVGLGRLKVKSALVEETTSALVLPLEPPNVASPL